MTQPTTYQTYLTARQRHKTALILVPHSPREGGDHFITFDDDAVLASAHCNLVPKLIDRHLTAHLEQRHVDQLKANEVTVHITQEASDG